MNPGLFRPKSTVWTWRSVVLSLVLAISMPAGAVASERSDCEGRFASFFSKPRRLLFVHDSSHPRAIEEFKEFYEKFTGVNKNHNGAFIREAFVENPHPRTFFDAENALLKDLNDKIIGDKPLVTALTNHYKEELHGAVMADPYLLSKLMSQYSDFKSLRLIFDGQQPELYEHLEQAYRLANEHFAQTVRRLGLLEKVIGAEGLAAHPETWHLAGIGSTLDEAGAAARHGRALGGAEKVAVQTFADAKPTLDQKVWAAESLRIKLERELSSAGFLVETPSSMGKRVLSDRAIDVIRKGSTTEADRVSNQDAIRQLIKENFSADITRRQAQILREYVTIGDGFVAGVVVPERVEIPFDKATYGLMSVDFVGQNSRNIQETLAGLARTAGERADSREALRQARLAERRATEQLEMRKKTLSDVVGKFYGEDGKKSVYFSGDDGVFLPRQTLSRDEKRALLWQFSRVGNPDDYRVVFVPPKTLNNRPIPSRRQGELFAAAERVEKKLRTRLAQIFTQGMVSRLMLASEVSVDEKGRAWLKPIVAGDPSPAVTLQLNRLLKEIEAESGFQFSSLEVVSPNGAMPRPYSRW